MPAHRNRPARSILTVLTAAAVVVVLLMAGTVGAHKWRKHLMIRSALLEGRAAYERQDWPEAGRLLGRYLAGGLNSIDPNRADVLQQYAHAQLSVQPLPVTNISRSIAAYRELLRLRPTDEAVYDHLAGLYRATGNEGELEHLSRKRLEQIPNDPKASLWLATAHILQQRPDAAREGLETLVQRLEVESQNAGDYVSACVLLSKLSDSRDTGGASDEALDWLNRAVARDPESSLALVHRGAFYRRRAENQARGTRDPIRAAARADLERAETMRILPPTVRLLLWQEWMALREYDRAAVQLAAMKTIPPEAVKDSFIDPTDWDVAKFVCTANLCLRTQNIQEGAAHAEAILEVLIQTPHRVRVIPFAIELFVAGDRLRAARELLDEYIQVFDRANPTSQRGTQVAYLKAILARAEGRPYDVIDAVEPVVRGEGAPVLLRTLLADAYARTGQNSRAASLLTWNGVQPTDDLAGTVRVVKSYISQGKWDRAARFSRDAIRFHPKNLELQLLRIHTEVSLAARRDNPSANKELETLAAELQMIRDANQDVANVYILLAFIHHLQDKPDLAEDVLRRGREKCPETPLAALELARFYATNQKTLQAIEVCRGATEQYPSFIGPWLRLVELLRADGRVDEAYEVLDAAHTAVPETAKHQIAVRIPLLRIIDGDRTDGIAQLKDLADADSTDLEVRSLLLHLPEVRAQPATASALINDLRKIQGETGLLWRYHQAEVWRAMDNWRSRRGKIEELLKYCVSAHPAWTAPALMLGSLYERDHDWSRAEETYQSAMSANASPAMVDRLLSLLQGQRRFDEARALVRRQSGRYTRQGLAARRLSVAFASGDLAGAIRELEVRNSGLSKKADELIVLARLVYIAQGDALRALRYLDEAEGAGADRITLARVRVFVLDRAGRKDEAFDLLDELVDANESLEARLLRAQHYEEDHEDSSARELAEKDYVELPRLSQDGTGHALLGSFLARTNRLEDAIQVWKEGRPLGGDPVARSLIKGLIMRGRPADFERAEELLDAKPSSDDAELLWLRAALLLRQDPDGAADRIKDLLEQAWHAQATTLQAYLGMIDLALRIEEFELARDLAARAESAYPRNSALMLAHARAAQALNEPALALILARTAIDCDKGNIDAYEMTVQLAGAGRETAILRDIEQPLSDAVAGNPGSERLQLLAAQVQTALGQPAAAVKRLEAFRRSSAAGVPTLLALVELYGAREEWDAAETLLGQAAKLAPKSGAVLRSRLRWLAARKKYDEVLRLAKAALDDESADATANLAAARILSNTGSRQFKQGAQQLFRAAHAKWPDDTPTHGGLALVTYELGEVAEAVALYQALLRKDPANADALNNLAWILAKDLKAYKQALPLARRAVELGPSVSNYRDTVGVILRQMPDQDNLETARDEFKACVDLTKPGTSKRARALLQLARVLYELDEQIDMRACLEEALQIDAEIGALDAAEKAEIEGLWREDAR